MAKDRPEVDQAGAIKFQPFYGGAASGRYPNDSGKIRTPGKMIPPVLLTWVIKRHHSTGDWVPGTDRREFMSIAAYAREI